MPMVSKKVVFVVGNNVQRENARNVALQLRTTDVGYLNLWTTNVEDSDSMDFPGHTAPVTAFRFVRLLKTLRGLSTDILVLPQDVGLLQRLAASRLRLSGSQIVLMPDGIVASSKIENGRFLKRVARDAVNEVLRMFRFVEGTAGSMGASQPDIVLGWGTGWEKSFNADGRRTLYMLTGCPRMDQYADLSGPPKERNLLICSQPLNIPSWSRPYAKEWYTFLRSLVESPIPDLNIRIRLHPAEKTDTEIPSLVKEQHRDRPLREDLEWSSSVASPFSTVLVEALAANRPCSALTRDDVFAEYARSYPLFADKRMAYSKWSRTELAKMRFSNEDMTVLRDTYLARVGNSSKTIATIFDKLLAGEPYA